MKPATNYIIFLTAVVFLSFCLSGCKKEEPAPNNNTANQLSPSEASPTPAELTEKTTENDTSLILEQVDEVPAEQTELPSQEGTTEMIDNPQYLSWAKFGVGTKVVFENTVESEGTVQKSIFTQTLTEVTPDSITCKITHQNSSTTEQDSQETPEFLQTIPAKVPAGTPIKPDDIPGVKILEQKEEVLTVGEKALKTRFTKYEMPAGDEENVFSSTTTVWESDEVPGNTVRMEIFTNMGESSSKTTISLMQFETN